MAQPEPDCFTTETWRITLAKGVLGGFVAFSMISLGMVKTYGGLNYIRWHVWEGWLQWDIGRKSMRRRWLGSYILVRVLFFQDSFIYHCRDEWRLCMIQCRSYQLYPERYHICIY